jgi:RimJ/RimL family protein N-acetyltransferase
MGSKRELTFEEAKKKIEPLLKKRFGWTEIPDFDVWDEKEIKKLLPCFEYLVTLKSPAAKLYLWNSIGWTFSYGALKCGCSPELKACLDHYHLVLNRYTNAKDSLLKDNINKPPMTERLILRGEDGPEGHDFQEYQKHLREDGDFTLYTSRALTETNLRAYHLHRPFCFVITAKDDGRMIGFCGFYPDGNIHKDNDLGHVELEYYIFKNERGHGYATEAVQALIKEAFRPGLMGYVTEAFNYVLIRKRIVISFIRVMINTMNKASLRTAEKLGFTKEGVLHEVLPFAGKKKFADMASYCLRNPYLK